MLESEKNQLIESIDRSQYDVYICHSHNSYKSMSTLEQLEVKLNTNYEIGITILPNSRRQALHLTVEGCMTITIEPHPECIELERYLNQYIRQCMIDKSYIDEYTSGISIVMLIGREIVRYFHRQIIARMTHS